MGPMLIWVNFALFYAGRIGFVGSARRTALRGGSKSVRSELENISRGTGFQPVRAM